jgi:hypothetical protein
MQPSPVEIQREVEALRDIRRRSTAQGGPGSLVLDPDLPIESSPTSPSAGYWTSGTDPGLTDGDSSSSSHEDSSSSERSSADDPFHLFWVPARLHPEIAPTEFRAFLKEHARNPPAEGAGGLSRSASAASGSSSGLGRRTSLLSRQYRPTESDGSEDEQVLPLRRNRSSIYNPGPQLTINDLQKLDQLAEEASVSDDPTKLRNILRRSLSLNVAPSGGSYCIILQFETDIHPMQLWIRWTTCLTQVKMQTPPLLSLVRVKSYAGQHVQKYANRDYQVMAVVIVSDNPLDVRQVVGARLQPPNNAPRAICPRAITANNSSRQNDTCPPTKAFLMITYSLLRFALILTVRKHHPFLMLMCRKWRKMSHRL